MSDDLSFLPALASLPAHSVLQFLLGAWRRLTAAAAALAKGRHAPQDMHAAHAVLERARDLLVSYAGLGLQEPGMFPQPAGLDPWVPSAPAHALIF
jgi:ubiquitin conjugation factor E4 B